MTIIDQTQQSQLDRAFPDQHNPGGAPAGRKGVRQGKLDVDVLHLAREQGLEAIATLAAIMNDESAPQTALLKATTSLFDRAYGRPAQSVEMRGGDGGPIQTQVDSPLESIMSRLAAIRERLQEEGGMTA